MVGRTVRKVFDDRERVRGPQMVEADLRNPRIVAHHLRVEPGDVRDVQWYRDEILKAIVLEAHVQILEVVCHDHDSGDEDAHP